MCGPDVDPALVQFAADLQALAASGVAVERFNLAQEPEAFVAETATLGVGTPEGTQPGGTFMRGIVFSGACSP